MAKVLDLDEAYLMAKLEDVARKQQTKLVDNESIESQVNDLYQICKRYKKRLIPRPRKAESDADLSDVVALIKIKPKNDIEAKAKQKALYQSKNKVSIAKLALYGFAFIEAAKNVQQRNALSEAYRKYKISSRNAKLSNSENYALPLTPLAYLINQLCLHYQDFYNELPKSWLNKADKSVDEHYTGDGYLFVCEVILLMSNDSSIELITVGDYLSREKARISKLDKFNFG